MMYSSRTTLLSLVLFACLLPSFATSWGITMSPAHFFDLNTRSFPNPRNIMKTFDQLESETDSMLRSFLEYADDMVGTEVAETENATEVATVKSSDRLRLRPRFDLQETEDGHILTVATPGLSKEEVNVDLVENDVSLGGPVLVISGQSKTKENSTRPAELPLRSHYKKFDRKIKLPAGTTRESLKAHYENGLLEVFIKDHGKKEVQSHKIPLL
ncbi:hypothetical protein GUITHDRAFT_110401 [Guillardia theta CCMP2712]|uniref:SHSP domain-containing protein n=1 Tax=Guillardia theta (strain CCMP2712) TaxID=905079 RepID=L1J4Y8_GUITC|nr:hypothetical protein GUITHDRAFT_110401 [Guillardia theta CCMP2712]EKX43598.1 hypothetical protein GUITHDRAFT_110401 [Guillardia theta CCMP2712]|eukprot:XP_005830578.1 hypothetical protein GUITHDRAFT_110401 [Guillardia theta CCMP2712]